MKWVPFVNRRYTKGVRTFLVTKWYFKGYKVGPQGRASTNKNLLRTSPLNPHPTPQPPPPRSPGVGSSFFPKNALQFTVFPQMSTHAIIGALPKYTDPVG